MLFTFPSRYWFAIGLPGVFSLAGWSRRIRAEFLVLRVTQDATRPCLASVTGLSPAVAGLSRPFSSRFRYHVVVLLPRRCVATQPVWALPRSLATTGGITKLFSLPQGTKMFQFPWFASLLSVMIAGLQPAGLSHSEIAGSRVICTYPALIAAYHVLHRLREPRHPPDALTCFRRLLQPSERDLADGEVLLILSAVIFVEIFIQTYQYAELSSKFLTLSQLTYIRRTQF